MSVRRSVGIALAAVSLTVGSVLSIASPAQASTRTFTDPSGDSGQATDIRTVRVKYAKRLTVVVTYPGSSLVGSRIHYFIDTARKNPGPEYALTVVPNSEISPLVKVSGFRDHRGEPVVCRGLRASADISSTRPRTSMSVPAKCITSPGKVRVAVRTKAAGGSDWARARRTFLGSVDRF